MITGAGETGRGQPAPPRLARLQDWSARHRVIIDILVGVLLVGGGLAPRAAIDPALWWTMGPQALLVAPLLARRRIRSPCSAGCTCSH
jgi:hypothetical protein